MARERRAQTAGRVFLEDETQHPNDWCVTRSGQGIHAFRFVDPTTIDHAVYDGSAWLAAPSPPQTHLAWGEGLVAATDGNNIVIAGISADEGNPVVATVLRDGAWRPWSTVVGGAATPRTKLSSYPALVNGELVLLWSDLETMTLHGTHAPVSAL